MSYLFAWAFSSQAFSQFRSKLAKKTEDEIETLKRNPKVGGKASRENRNPKTTAFQVWNVHSVLNVLHSLVDKSNINKQLEVSTISTTLATNI